MTKKSIIMGNGLLGSEFIAQTNWDYISRKKDGFDFSKPETYFCLLDQYDIIINCIGYINTYDTSKTNHQIINYESVLKLSDFCKETNKKLVHISTDYVYSNSISNATENDLALISPDWYSYYKLLTDEYIILHNNDYIICRCSFKPRPFPYNIAWVDRIGNFDYVDVITKQIIKLIEIDARGLFNVGTQIKTMYELALQTRPNVQKGVKPPHVPGNVSMNLDKFNEVIKNM